MTDEPTVVRVITWLPLGGIERRLATVAPRLAAMGWNVRIVCLREEGPLAKEFRQQGIPVDVIPQKSRLSPPGIRRLARYFRQHEAKVVHGHMYRSNIPSTIAGRLARVPAVFGQVHNVDSWDSGRQVLVDRIVSRWRKGTITVSKAVQKDVMKRLGVAEEQAPVLYNGIDVEAFRPQSEKGDELRREWGAGEDQVVFVVPARLHPQKNPAGVIEAMSRVASQWGEDAPLLCFAGGGKMGKELECLAREKGWGEHIRFLGPQDDMARIYNAADAVVLSSFKEGFSNAVVEGLACGKPVIASDVGGNAEAISGERFGWIHPAGDTEKLAEQMLHACHLGRDGLAGMSADCRGRAEQFSVDALVEQTHDLYLRALGGKP